MFKITTTEDGRALITTPYNTRYVALIKRIGGARWNPEAKAWSIPESEIDTAREYMLEVYGETDLPDDDERFPVRVTVMQDIEKVRDSISMYGKMIARARGRDSGAMIGPDVLMEEGSPTSGGSSQYWKTIIPKGSVMKIRNVTRTAFLAEKEDERWQAVIVNKPSVNREALLKEKEKLCARLKEIDRLLQTEDITLTAPKQQKKRKKGSKK